MLAPGRITGISHIAIAPSDQGALLKVMKILGLEVEHEEVVASEMTKTAFLSIRRSGDDAQDHIELIADAAPDGETGPVGKFLNKKGGGIHHIAFAVENIDELAQRLQSAKIRLTSENPKAGAHNSRVIFIHPKETGGILIELVESLK